MDNEDTKDAAESSLAPLADSGKNQGQEEKEGQATADKAHVIDQKEQGNEATEPFKSADNHVASSNQSSPIGESIHTSAPPATALPDSDQQEGKEANCVEQIQQPITKKSDNEKTQKTAMPGHRDKPGHATTTRAHDKAGATMRARINNQSQSPRVAPAPTKSSVEKSGKANSGTHGSTASQPAHLPGKSGNPPVRAAKLNEISQAASPRGHNSSRIAASKRVPARSQDCNKPIASAAKQAPSKEDALAVTEPSGDRTNSSNAADTEDGEAGADAKRTQIFAAAALSDEASSTSHPDAGKSAPQGDQAGIKSPDSTGNEQDDMSKEDQPCEPPKEGQPALQDSADAQHEKDSNDANKVDTQIEQDMRNLSAELDAFFFADCVAKQPRASVFRYQDGALTQTHTDTYF
jgi:hypothetical protein